VTEQPAESSRKAQRLARGGFAIIGILLTATNLRAPLTVVGPLVPALQEQVDMSAVAASNLVTIPVLCFGLASPLAPVLARLMGLERALGAAMAATSLGIVLRSLPGSPFLWGGTILLGCAIAMLNVLLPALIRRDFPLKISQITGWYQVVQTVVAGAAAAFAVPVAGLVDNGWRLAFGVTAGFGMISLAVFWPRIMNPVRQAAPLPLTTGQISVPKSAINPWKSLVGWQVSIFMGLQSSLFYTAITWFPAIEHDAGFTTTEAGAHQGLLQLAGVAGNSMGAWLFCALEAASTQGYDNRKPVGAYFAARAASASRSVDPVAAQRGLCGRYVYCDGHCPYGFASKKPRTDREAVEYGAVGWLFYCRSGAAPVWQSA
jgi:CP family cyanate transporter-like MFS transporter